MFGGWKGDTDRVEAGRGETARGGGAGGREDGVVRGADGGRRVREGERDGTEGAADDVAGPIEPFDAVCEGVKVVVSDVAAREQGFADFARSHRVVQDGRLYRLGHGSRAPGGAGWLGHLPNALWSDVLLWPVEYGDETRH